MTTKAVFEIAADCIEESIVRHAQEMGERVDADEQYRKGLAMERIRALVRQESGTDDYTGQRELERPFGGS